MAFYGRVTNDSKTSMTFDRIYPNVITMDAYAEDGDGVFTGRFVLVEYSENPGPDEKVQAYINKKYPESATKYQDECQEAADELDKDSDNAETIYYNHNYNIDKIKYPKLGKGYDSTVWRKTVDENGVGKYVMLAELNTVVPTFDIRTAAPGSLDKDGNPFQPHFDKDASNIYYPLHIEGNWKFDVNTPDINESGFHVLQSHHDGGENKITCSPTKSSGLLYYDDETDQYSSKPDTQVLDIKLPGIGDMVATGYDVIYGPNDDTGYRRTNIIWRDATDATADNNWRHLVTQDNDYVPNDIGNLAGAVNSAFDIMGMIITNKADDGETELTDEEWQDAAADATNNYIYYRKGDKNFYYKGYKYDYDTDVSTPPESPKIIKIDSNKIFQYKTPLYKAIGKNSYKISDDKTAKSDVKYYSLDLTKFNEETRVNKQTVGIDFLQLKKNGHLYELSKSADGNYELIVPAGDAPESNKTYCYVEKGYISPSGEKGYYPEGSRNIDLFLDSKAVKIAVRNESFSFSPGAEEGVIYQMTTESEQPYIDPDTGEESIIYTRRLEPKAISEELAADEDKLNKKSAAIKALAAAEKVLYIWPTRNTDLFTTQNNEISINPSYADREEDFIWIKDEENNKFVLRSSRPADSGSEFSIEPFVTGKKRITIYTLTGLKIIKTFYKPNTSFWGIEKNNTTITKVYLKTTEQDDTNETYNLALLDDPDYNNIVVSERPGVNPYDTDNETPVYFVPNVLFEKDQNNNYVLAKEYKDNTDYYKKFEIYIAGFGQKKEDNTYEQIDPLGIYNAGQRWNPKLNLDEVNQERADNEKVILGYKIAKPAFIELKEYAKTDNTINGLILHLNRLLGDGEDINTRDENTIQGLINSMRDKINIIEDLAPNSIIISDKDGHLNNGNLENIDAFKDLQDQIKEHKRTQLSISGTGNLIGNLTVSDGAITATKTNVGNLNLTDYALGTDGTAITNSDTINKALSKLQVQINTVVGNQANDLVQNFSSSGEGDYISTLLLDNNTKTLSATIGKLADGILSNYDISSSDINGNVNNTDSIVKAIAKLQKQINNIVGGEGAVNSFTSTGSGNNVTGLTLSNGKLTATLNNLTSVDLAGFSQGTATGAIAATDSLGTALSKLQANITAMKGDTYVFSSVENNYAKIFRQEAAPTGTLKSGWIWIQTSTKYVYFYTGDTWELLNSWQ